MDTNDYKIKFQNTFDSHRFLFDLPEDLAVPNATGPEMSSKIFCSIPEKIDSLLRAKSIHDYVYSFAKINSLDKIKNRHLQKPKKEFYNGIEFNLAGNSPDFLKQDDQLQNIPSGKSVEAESVLLNPLQNKIKIDDRRAEIDSIKFSLFCEQTAINFGIELCILISEGLESERSKYDKLEKLDSVEWFMHRGILTPDYKNKVQFKEFVKEQGKRLFPKAWELYTDNKKLIFHLSRLKYLKSASSLEPYFLQTDTFHKCFSQTPFSSMDRLKQISKFFQNIDVLKRPILNIRIVGRALLLLRTFNPEVFTSEPKQYEVIISALRESKILSRTYKSNTMRSAYMATMRNHSGSGKSI